NRCASCGRQLHHHLLGIRIENDRGNLERRREFNGCDLERSHHVHSRLALLGGRQLKRRGREIRNQVQTSNGEGWGSDDRRTLLLRRSQTNAAQSAPGGLNSGDLEGYLQVHRWLR